MVDRPEADLDRGPDDQADLRPARASLAADTERFRDTPLDDRSEGLHRPALPYAHAAHPVHGAVHAALLAVLRRRRGGEGGRPVPVRLPVRHIAQQRASGPCRRLRRPGPACDRVPAGGGIIALGKRRQADADCGCRPSRAPRRGRRGTLVAASVLLARPSQPHAAEEHGRRAVEGDAGTGPAAAHRDGARPFSLRTARGHGQHLRARERQWAAGRPAGLHPGHAAGDASIGAADLHRRMGRARGRDGRRFRPARRGAPVRGRSLRPIRHHRPSGDHPGCDRLDDGSRPRILRQDGEEHRPLPRPRLVRAARLPVCGDLTEFSAA